MKKTNITTCTKCGKVKKFNKFTLLDEKEMQAIESLYKKGELEIVNTTCNDCLNGDI